MRKMNRPLLEAAILHFGAWPKALMAAGVDPQAVGNRRTWTIPQLSSISSAGRVHSPASCCPATARYVGASSNPFAEYKRKRGDRVGLHWRIPNTIGRRQVRHVLIDTNYWRTFVHARLAVAMGDPGCLSLPGHDEKAHRMLADHLTSEYRVKSLAQGRTVDEWKLRATRPDNHWLDCLVGCAAAASIQGATLADVDSRSTQSLQRVRLSELQKQR